MGVRDSHECERPAVLSGKVLHGCEKPAILSEKLCMGVRDPRYYLKSSIWVLETRGVSQTFCCLRENTQSCLSLRPRVE